MVGEHRTRQRLAPPLLRRVGIRRAATLPMSDSARYRGGNALSTRDREHAARRLGWVRNGKDDEIRPRHSTGHRERSDYPWNKSIMIGRENEHAERNSPRHLASNEVHCSCIEVPSGASHDAAPAGGLRRQRKLFQLQQLRPQSGLSGVQALEPVARWRSTLCQHRKGVPETPKGQWFPLLNRVRQARPTRQSSPTARPDRPPACTRESVDHRSE